MSADVSWLLIEERPLDMDAPNQVGYCRVSVANAVDIRESPAHCVQIRRDHGCQDAGDTLLSQSLTYRCHTLGRKLIGVEINIAIPVDLQVDIAAGSIHN